MMFESPEIMSYRLAKIYPLPRKQKLKTAKNLSNMVLKFYEVCLFLLKVKATRIRVNDRTPDRRLRPGKLQASCVLEPEKQLNIKCLIFHSLSETGKTGRRPMFHCFYL